METDQTPPQPPALLGVAGGGMMAGVLLALADIARLQLTHAQNLSLGFDRWIVLIGVFASLTLVSVLLGLALWGWERLITRLVAHPAFVRTGILATPLTAAVALLNTHILARAPAAWAALILATLVATTGFLTLRFPSSRRPARAVLIVSPILAVLLLVGAIHADATLYVGLYPMQHRTLGLAAALAALWLVEDGRRVFRRPHPVWNITTLGVASLTWATLFSLGPEDVSQNARYLAYRVAPLTSHALRGIGVITDWDRDDEPALFGAGDCDNEDPNVHPGAVEIPDNGIDDDCLGGDFGEEDRALYAARTAAPPPHPRPALRHLVWISVDALRRDRLDPPTEGHRDVAPNLRRIAATGIRFKRLYAEYPSTILSLYSAATSLYPSQVSLSAYHQFEVPSNDPNPTVAQTLRTAGLRTGGFWFHHIFNPAFGIGRGFETAWVAGNTPEIVGGTIAGAETVDRALRWVDEHAQERLFLWVHLYDPHDPYLAHEDYPFGEDDEARYDAEVAYTDAQIGRLIEGLRARGVLDDAQVWIFADHGEEFGDHGGRFHATSLYDELVRIPGVLLIPGVPPRTIERPVSLVDLAPTSLDLLGLRSLRPPSFRGRSLVPLLSGEQTPSRPVFSECFRKDGVVLRAVVDGPWKLILSREDHFFELYNLDRDPAEKRNVFDLLPREARSMEKLLGAWVGAELSRPSM